MIGVLTEVHVEHQKALEKWSRENDDANTDGQWNTYISEYLYQTSCRALRRGRRESLIAVAALAISAIEALDRRTE